MRKLVPLAVLAAALMLTATAEGAVKRLETTMTGAKEAPAQGDPDGRGTARIRVNAAERRVCFTIRMQNIDPSIAAHIHRGAPGVAGGIEVPLFEGRSTATRRSGCMNGLKRSLLREIARHPRRFYVNVHTEAYPAGAIRGQLRVAT